MSLKSVSGDGTDVLCGFRVQQRRQTAALLDHLWLPCTLLMARFVRDGVYAASLTGSVFIGNTQLALQIIKRNQLLPAVKTLSEMRKKPVFQPVHPVQPIQMPAFTAHRK